MDIPQYSEDRLLLRWKQTVTSQMNQGLIITTGLKI